MINALIPMHYAPGPYPNYDNLLGRSSQSKPHTNHHTRKLLYLAIYVCVCIIAIRRPHAHHARAVIELMPS